jgi:tRNA A-37 threonylcarbamoyl transferase component Bud32
MIPGIMKTVINPTYNDLKSFVERIPSIFELQGESIYKDRNELKCYTTDGYHIVVKKFRKPHIINRIAYSFFRPSKAKRAYEFALKLLQVGVETPAPIAFIEQYESGLLAHGYFICIFEKEYEHIRDLMDGTQKDSDLLKKLAMYIADLHANGVLHLDMSPGNILYKKSADKVHFSLVDNNRMQFMPIISTEKRYKSLKRLTEDKEILIEMAKYYAKASGLDEAESIEKISRYSAKFFSGRN